LHNFGDSGEITLSVADEILDVLKNGEWHWIHEISEKTQLSVFKLELLIKFLAKYKFIELDKTKQRTKLTPPLVSFIRKIQNDDLQQKDKTLIFRF
jgi:DNA-binding IclR family transcriptional regulator